MPQELTGKASKDLKVLSEFIAIFCRESHRTVNKDAFPNQGENLRQSLGKKELLLCPECTKLLQHGIAKRLACPHNPKPMCKNCKTQCYASSYREEIRKVMRFSGLYLIKHRRLDLLVHYFF
jgi:hypothetical protein